VVSYESAVDLCDVSGVVPSAVHLTTHGRFAAAQGGHCQASLSIRHRVRLLIVGCSGSREFAFLSPADAVLDAAESGTQAEQATVSSTRRSADIGSMWCAFVRRRSGADRARPI
jgi:hypothetical protein